MSTYNNAVKYLIDKYGKINCGLTCIASNAIIKSRNKKEADSIRKDDANYIYTYVKPPTENHDDYLIHVLLTQYCLGIYAKQELEMAVSKINLVKSI